MSSQLTRELRSNFDLYSERPLHRTLVLLTLLVGVVWFVAGLPNGSYAGAVPLLFLAWANHERLFETIGRLFDSHRWLTLAIPLLVLPLVMFQSPPVALDDLSRHLAQAFWPAGYQGMYVHTGLPPISLYPSFDSIAGWLARSIGPFPAMWVIQALAWIAFLSVFVLASLRLLDGHRDPFPMVLVALVAVLPIVSSRLMLARPEAFMAIWAMAALLPRGRVGAGIWALTGLALGTGYWLAPIYFVAAALLAVPWRARAGIFAALSLGWLLIWWWLSDGRLIEGIHWTLGSVADRVPGLRVGENGSILAGAMSLPTIVALAAATWYCWKGGAGDRRLLWIAAFFAIPGQIRYLGIIAPLVALFVLSALRDRSFETGRAWRLVLMLLSVSMLHQTSSQFPRYAHAPVFELPEGSVVMTGFTPATYLTLAANPGTVSVAPAFEVGALDPRLQQVVLDLIKGEFHCRRIEGFGFTHLIENGLRGPVPDCLMLEQTREDWRLWRIVPEKTEPR
jgi:hypothetical protein